MPALNVASRIALLSLAGLLTAAPLFAQEKKPESAGTSAMESITA